MARDKILALKPDVLTLDIEMPRMDGLTFLKRLMHYSPIPTIIISSLAQASCAATLEALRWGAVDVLAKPAGPYSVGELRLSLAEKVRGAAGARLHIATEPRWSYPDDRRDDGARTHAACRAGAAFGAGAAHRAGAAH